MPKPSRSRVETAAKERLLASLKEHGELSDQRLQLLRDFLVMSDYFSQPNHRGGLMCPGQKYYRMDGQEHTFDDVPFLKVLNSVRNHIQNDIPKDRRTTVYHKVLAGMPGYKETPDWDLPPDDPNKEPRTPFSVSKPGFEKPNAELIDTLAAAARLDAWTAACIGAQITWWDSIGECKYSCGLSLAPVPKVTGGRLGRDHTLEDVHNHFVRDKLLDYINTQLKESKREDARKAVFPDLDDDELKEYSRLVEEDNQERLRAQAQDNSPAEVRSRSEVRVRQDYTIPRNDAEAINLNLQNDAVENVFEDDTADLSIRCVGGIRNTKTLKPISKSVVQPDSKMLPEEEQMQIDDQSIIDRDCDQVRVMIKRFVGEGEWTADEFRRALGGQIGRTVLIEFLERRGPRAGMGSRAFQLSWEFFHRREKLGLPLSGAKRTDVVPLKTRRQKRGRADAGDKSARGKGKRTRTRREPLQEVVNGAE